MFESQNFPAFKGMSVMHWERGRHSERIRTYCALSSGSSSAVIYGRRGLSREAMRLFFHQLVQQTASAGISLAEGCLAGSMPNVLQIRSWKVHV